MALFRIIGIGIVAAVIFVVAAGGDAAMVGEGVGNIVQATGDFFTGLMSGFNDTNTGGN